MPAPIVELNEFPSASGLPHSIAVEGENVYVASRETRRIDVMDRTTWMKVGELTPPGMPWGMTFGRGELTMTCGEGDDDNRRVRSYSPDGGFATSFIACPDDTGSHLAIYNNHVLLAQWYNQKLLLLNDDGTVSRSYDAPHGIAGVAVSGDTAYLVCTDDEDEGEYWVSAVDLKSGSARDVATIPFKARGLFYDGTAFWTNHREGNRTVTFELPGSN